MRGARQRAEPGLSQALSTLGRRVLASWQGAREGRAGGHKPGSGRPGFHTRVLHSELRLNGPGACRPWATRRAGLGNAPLRPAGARAAPRRARRRKCGGFGSARPEADGADVCFSSACAHLLQNGNGSAPGLVQLGQVPSAPNQPLCPPRRAGGSEAPPTPAPPSCEPPLSRAALRAAAGRVRRLLGLLWARSRSVTPSRLSDQKLPKGHPAAAAAAAAARARGFPLPY